MRRARGGVRRAPPGRSRRRVRLVELAHARSGDKGDTANVGLIALKPEYFPLLLRQVTAATTFRSTKVRMARLSAI